MLRYQVYLKTDNLFALKNSEDLLSLFTLLKNVTYFHFST